MTSQYFALCSLRYGPPQHTLEADVAVLRFDLDVDLRPVWNWNVKMLFVYITAEYETPSHVSAAAAHNSCPADCP